MITQDTGSLRILVAWLQSGGGTSELVVSHKGTAICFLQGPQYTQLCTGPPREAAAGPELDEQAARSYISS